MCQITETEYTYQNKIVALSASKKTRSPWLLYTKCHGAGNCSNFETIRKFKEYIEFTEDLTLKFELKGISDGELLSVTIPYTHRWKEIYRNRTIARFYKFNDWWVNEGKPPLTMLTLTTYQDTEYAQINRGERVSLEDSFRLLSGSWDNLRKVLHKIRKEDGETLEYLRVMEPHESGYPHYHIAVKGSFTKEQQNRLNSLWSDKYNAGSYAHGLDISDVNTKTDLAYAGFYLFKYLGKSFAKSPEEMTPGELLFSSQLWKYKYRQWSASKGIRDAMKLDIDTEKRYDLVSVTMHKEGWQKDITKLKKSNILYQSGPSPG